MEFGKIGGFRGRKWAVEQKLLWCVGGGKLGLTCESFWFLKGGE